MDARGSAPFMTLGEIVGEASLRLAPVVAGDPALSVSGAHTSEIDDPGPWFEPGSIMLTTGLRFVGAEDDAILARQLVGSLREAGVAALFFGIGVYFDQVPATLVAACRTSGFPLYTVAAEVPFYVVENFANQSRVSPDSYQLRRAMRLTNDLLETMSHEDPARSLIARLGAVCRGTAVLYEESGRVVEATGEGPVHLIWTELQQRGGDGSFEVGRWKVMARPLVLRGNGYRLALASRNAGVVEELGDVLLETTQRLLGAISGINQLAMSRERHEGIQLLTALQDGIPGARELRFWERMKPFRFEPYTRLRAVIALALDNAPLPPTLAERLLDYAGRSGLGLLLAESGRTPESPPGFHALVAESAVLDGWLQVPEGKVVIGLSESFGDLAATPEAFREAETAAGIARRQVGLADTGASGSHYIVRLDEVDPASWLLARRDSPREADKLTRYVEALRREPGLLSTVVRYLALDMDVARTAESLFLHGNTVRYRLRKAEELLGGKLSEAAVVANLYLALKDEIAAQRAGTL